MARGQQKELFEQVGVIEAVARTGKAFKIGDDWFSVFHADQMAGAQKGDNVTFEYSVTNKGGKDFLNVEGDLNIDGEAPKQRAPARQAPARQGSGPSGPPARRAAPASSGGSSAPSGNDPRQRSIVRQNSLTQANALLATLGRAGLLGEPDTTDLATKAIALARLFEAYSMGED